MHTLKNVQEKFDELLLKLEEKGKGRYIYSITMNNTVCVTRSQRYDHLEIMFEFQDIQEFMDRYEDTLKFVGENHV